MDPTEAHKATRAHPATLAIHATDADLPDQGGATPLYLDNAFSFESAEALEAVFSGQYGALLTLRLADRAACFRFINALTLARNLANIGDASTLVIHPASTFCRELDAETRQAVGVSDDLVRFSIGLEEPSDIISDFHKALIAAQTPPSTSSVCSQTDKLFTQGEA